MFKRIFKNLQWLFNHPPVDVTSNVIIHPCDYCNEFNSNFNLWDLHICHFCLKKAVDKVLKEVKNAL